MRVQIIGFLDGTTGNGRLSHARGDKSKYTDKQKRKAEHIAESYEARGVPENVAEGRAWATVNKESGGGNKSGRGGAFPTPHVSSEKGGKVGGEASAARPASARSASAKKRGLAHSGRTIGLGEESGRHPEAEPGEALNRSTSFHILGKAVRPSHSGRRAAAVESNGRAAAVKPDGRAAAVEPNGRAAAVKPTGGPPVLLDLGMVKVARRTAEGFLTGGRPAHENRFTFSRARSD